MNDSLEFRPGQICASRRGNTDIGFFNPYWTAFFIMKGQKAWSDRNQTRNNFL